MSGKEDTARLADLRHFVAALPRLLRSTHFGTCRSWAGFTCNCPVREIITGAEDILERTS